MKIYNTLTRQKEELTPLEGNQIKMYVCGPTVYDFIHIGNARPMCVFDCLRRYLEYRGFQVLHVQNFTDIDDKIIRRAIRENLDFKTVSEKFIKEYEIDAHGLNVLDAVIQPKATENIENIIEMVSKLIEKGFAYESNGDVYFSTKKFNGYGKLSHQPMEELEAGARISVGELKKDAMDFALWKAAKPGEPFWDSPWGKGRPGWHIECSAMSGRYLGKTIDIHGGGQDLIFPHHENEIAQSEACNGVPFARYWMHNGFITIDNKKMSKSEGNFFTVRDVAKQFGYEAIRFLMISCHYRSPINYSYDSLTQCKASLQRFYTCRDALDFAIKNGTEEAVSEQVSQALENRVKAFCDAMDDDLNTADAIAVLFDLVRDINKLVLTETPSKAAAKLAAEKFDELSGVLGLLYQRKEEKSLDDQVQAMIEARNAARKEKNWAEADRIRDELKAMGIVLEDTPQGVKWHLASTE